MVIFDNKFLLNTWQAWYICSSFKSSFVYSTDGISQVSFFFICIPTFNEEKIILGFLICQYLPEGYTDIYVCLFFFCKLKPLCSTFCIFSSNLTRNFSLSIYHQGSCVFWETIFFLQNSRFFSGLRFSEPHPKKSAFKVLHPICVFFVFSSDTKN